MFGTRTRQKPPERPFAHTAECKTPNSQPEWWLEPGTGGLWKRTCCFTDTWRDSDSNLDPSGSATEPAWTAHEHGPDCEATKVPQVIRTEQREGGTGWRTTCMACGTVCIYFWRPDMEDAEGRPITREGPVRYGYPLKLALVAGRAPGWNQ